VNLRLLREETQAQHEATEAVMPLGGAALTRARYGQILQCYSRFVSAWEDWAEAHVPARLAALVEERRRSPLLLRDLEVFGLRAEPGQRSDVPSLDAALGKDSPEYEAAFLGSMYVMEGSTLGGQYIARQVEDVLGLTPGEGDAYFRGYGEETGAMWNAFRQVLSEIPEEHSRIVIASAKATFEYVQEVMRSCPYA
jgi:heme oxygenase (biliverdin-IX-beta and delta-forming)